MLDIPKTIDEALVRWDNGDAIISVKTSDFGLGDEQATQILMMEIIRAYRNTVLPMTAAEWRNWANDIVKQHVLAQEHSAKTFAFHFLALGWPDALKNFNPERHIIVRKFLPKSPEGGETMTTEHT